MSFIQKVTRQISCSTTQRTCLEFFQDLEKLRLAKVNNVILYGHGRVKQKTFSREGYLDEFMLGDTHVYGKKFDEQSLYSIASSKMLNDTLHCTPPLAVLQDAGGYLRTASEDILPIAYLDDEYEILPAYKVSKLANLTDIYSESRQAQVNEKYGKWSPLYIQSEKEKFLEIMTEECFNELVNHFLVAELRTDSDRHQGNYFLVRKKGSPKFETIIQIDLERSEILLSAFIQKKSFADFVKNKEYYSRDFHGYVEDKKNYITRMKEMQKLVQSGNLNTIQTLQLKEVLEYDLPKTLRRTIKHYSANPEIDIYSETTYDRVSRLWEYNLTNLGREIDL